MADLSYETLPSDEAGVLEERAWPLGGALSAPGTVRVLHIVPRHFGAEGYTFHGSVKDIEGRRAFFLGRGIETDLYFHDKTDQGLSGLIEAHPPGRHTHILLDGSFPVSDWILLRDAYPGAKLILRSHNSELPHRKDTRRAIRLLPFPEKVRHGAIKNVRVYSERDIAAAKYADWILSIEPGRPTERYWRRLGFKGRYAWLPYYLSDTYVKELRSRPRLSHDGVRITCVLSAFPGPVTYESAVKFIEAVKRSPERDKDVQLSITGTLTPKLYRRVGNVAPDTRLLGVVDDLVGLLAESDAVAVLSDLGRGFKTKILEAIVSGAWVLVTPTLFKRLPDEVRPYCLIVDTEAKGGLKTAVARLRQKSWPGGDPNVALRRGAFEVMARVFAEPTPPRAPTVSLRADRDPLSDSFTLCTVITPFHRRVASINHQITERLNPGLECRWVVVDNHDIHLNPKKVKAAGFSPKKPEEFAAAKAERADRVDFSPPAETWQVIPGPSLDSVRDGVRAALGTTPEQHKMHEWTLGKTLGSYHHAAGLNLAMSAVKSRFAIVIDPDFYVVRPDWVREVLGHMDRNGIAVFGAPWNPRWFQKFRYFPCSHFLALDLSKIDWRPDLLAPDLVRPGPPYISKLWLDLMAQRAEGGAGWLLELWRQLPEAIREDREQRRTVGASRDTAYELLCELKRRPDLKSGVLTPVYDPAMGFQPRSVSPFQRNLLLDRFLPEERCYLPKQRGYMSARGFDEAGWPDVRGFGWEEFLWREAPFGFHVRGEAHRKGLHRFNDVQILNALNHVLGRHGLERLPDTFVCGDLDPAVAPQS